MAVTAVVIAQAVIEIAGDDANFLSKSLYQFHGIENICAVVFVVFTSHTYFESRVN